MVKLAQNKFKEDLREDLNNFFADRITELDKIAEDYLESLEGIYPYSRENYMELLEKAERVKEDRYSYSVEEMRKYTGTFDGIMGRLVTFIDYEGNQRPIKEVLEKHAELIRNIHKNMKEKTSREFVREYEKSSIVDMETKKELGLPSITDYMREEVDIYCSLLDLVNAIEMDNSEQVI